MNRRRFVHTSGDASAFAIAGRLKLVCQRGRHCTKPPGVTSRVLPIEGKWLCVFCAMDYLNVLYMREALWATGWQVT